MKTPWRELGTMALIGDGAAGLIKPRQHCLNWRIGPKPYRRMIDTFVKHPNVTRMLAATEVALGIWLITREPSR